MKRKITLAAGTIATGPITITLGATHATEWRVTAEHLAIAWNRPLAEILARLARLSSKASEKDLAAFGKWLLDAGPTAAAKAAVNTTKT